MDFEGKPQSLLTFRVGPVLCCAPSLPVRSIITPPKLTHIAGSEPSTPGIFKHGAHIVKVLDLRLKFGVNAAQHTHPGNLVVTISEAGDFAFWVDQILDVFDFPKEGWGKLPPAIPRGIFTRTLLLNNKIHLYSEFEKLATITNLGYLEQYIKQLTEEKTVKSTENEIIDSSLLSSSEKTQPSKPADTKITTTESTNLTAGKTSPLNESPRSPANTKPVAALLDTSSTEPKTVKPTTKKSTNQTRSQSTSSLSQLTANSPTRTSTSRSASSILNTDSSSVTSQGNVSKTSPAISSGITTAKSPSSAAVTKKPVLTSTTSAQTSSSSNTVNVQAKHITQSVSSTVSREDKKEVFTLPKSTSARSQTTPDYEDEASSSSASIIVLFLLLLLLPGAGIYYYFSQQVSKPYRYIAEKNTKPKIPATETTDNSSTSTVPEQDEIVRTDNQTVETAEKEIQEAVKTETIQESISKPADKTEAVASSEYYANITQQEDEITITIHQPATDESHQALISPLPVEDSIEDSNEENTVAVIETTPVKTLDDQIAQPIQQEKIIKEIVHVVVKGDTLWAIAKKYVKNPFLYPELARLSNIKNPHRIYPGNRVRIRFTNN